MGGEECGGGGGNGEREGELCFHVNQNWQLSGSTHAQIEVVCAY